MKALSLEIRPTLICFKFMAAPLIVLVALMMIVSVFWGEKV